MKVVSKSDFYFKQKCFLLKHKICWKSNILHGKTWKYDQNLEMKH